MRVRTVIGNHKTTLRRDFMDLAYSKRLTAYSLFFVPHEPLFFDFFLEIDLVMFGEQENMAEDISHFFVEFFSNLFFSFVFLSAFAGHHEVTLDELAHFFLEFEDVPVGISSDAVTLGVDIGDFFDLPGYFVDVHERDYNMCELV